MPVWQRYFIIFFCGLIFSCLSTRLKLKSRTQKLLKKIGLILLVFYASFLFYLTLTRYYNFSSEVIDLSYFHSTIRQLAEFKIPRVWDTPRRFVWGDHFHPILLIFVPLYWFYQSAGLLFSLQVLIVLFGIWPLYLITKHKFKSDFLSLAFCFSYLLFGGLQMGYSYGWHEIMLFPTFFFWTWFFYETKKLKRYWFFLILTLMIKEEVAFITFFLGLYLFLVKKARKIGFGTMVLGVFWYILCFKIVIPYFNLDHKFTYWGYYRFTLNPLKLLQNMITPVNKIDTFFHTFGSFGFLPFLSPVTILLVIPSLMQKLLCSDIARFNGFHYSSAITGVTLVACVEALAKLKKRPVFWASFILFVSLFTNFYYGYRPLSFFHFRLSKVRLTDHHSLLYQVIKLIPNSASVTAQYQLAPHFNRPFGKILDVPTKDEQQDFVLLDLKLPLVLTTPKEHREYLLNLSNNGYYQLIWENDGILLFGKIK
ncbi:MAG TPA: DUF2079 domain-containing protein [Candidatus Bathyarchaeia archaeon]|nr:DUF2079 domain-containing protein [Candidatus Bathyarchaeia archaeon]